MLISGVQQSDSAAHTQVYTFCFKFLPARKDSVARSLLHRKAGSAARPLRTLVCAAPAPAALVASSAFSESVSPSLSCSELTVLLCEIPHTSDAIFAFF